MFMASVSWPITPCEPLQSSTARSGARRTQRYRRAFRDKSTGPVVARFEEVSARDVRFGSGQFSTMRLPR